MIEMHLSRARRVLATHRTQPSVSVRLIVGVIGPWPHCHERNAGVLVFVACKLLSIIRQGQAGLACRTNGDETKLKEVVLCREVLPESVWRFLVKHSSLRVVIRLISLTLGIFRSVHNSRPWQLVAARCERNA